MRNEKAYDEAPPIPNFSLARHRICPIFLSLPNITWFKVELLGQGLWQKLLEPLEELQGILADPGDEVGLLEAGRQEVRAGGLPGERAVLVTGVVVGGVVPDQLQQGVLSIACNSKRLVDYLALGIVSVPVSSGTKSCQGKCQEINFAQWHRIFLLCCKKNE